MPLAEQACRLQKEANDHPGMEVSAPARSLLAWCDRALVEQVLASLFGLTPTEARIALALAEGQRTDEIATQMKISTTTVAFHLRNLFQKTDTHRQAELIALVLAGSMTLAVEETPPGER